MEKFPLNPTPMFADRGTDVADAMHYATELAAASSDSIAVYTAVNVLMNTVINWVNAQSDQPAADPQFPVETEIRFTVAKWMDVHAATMIADWCGDNHDVEDWLEQNAGMTIEHWMNYNAQPKMGEAIEEALEELDLENKIEEVIGNMDLEHQIESAIQDMDLVVRVR